MTNPSNPNNPYHIPENKTELTEFIQKNRTLMISEGILFVVLGSLAVALPVFSTFALEIFLGWLLVFAGLFQGARAFLAKKTNPFLMILTSALLYFIIGILLLAYPLTGVLTLTVLMMSLYFVQGIVQIIMGFQYRSIERSGWLIFSGLVTLLLAFLIWQGFPGTASWVLGLLAGINFLFFGFAMLAIALGTPKQIQD